MHKNFFLKNTLVLACIVLLSSCDKEYNAIGDGLIGENHFDFNKYTSNVIAYNQKVGPVQSNGLEVNALGILDDAAFGTTTANFATQVVSLTANPVIGDNPVIESVVLTVPYFSTLKSTDKDGNNVYELDSIYGPSDAKIKLSVYESGYFMRDSDPIGGFQQAQKYFTDQNSDFNALKVGNRLNDAVDGAQNDAFFFDNTEYVESVTDADGKVTKTKTAPGMRLNLNKTFFKTKIIDAVASGKLASNDVFKNYFRGLYFKVEKSGSSPSSLAVLNFAKGEITIKYKEDLSTTTAGVTTISRVEKSILLKMSGNTVSLLNESNVNTAYANATNNPNVTLGDEKLYLKGGQGSMVILDLFSTAGELETIRSNGWLINEANLVFHVDASAMASSNEPNRIYLYDLNNNRPVVDYFNDQSTGLDVKKYKLVFGGVLNKSAAANGRGTDYKIRITNQIRNLIKNADSTNVKLGVVVTEDINNTFFYTLKTPTTFVSKVPKPSVMNPLGTVLFGTNIPLGSADYDKRLKLEIFYTKPN